jgi:uncharacterized protein (TIGR03083 family)
VETDYAEYVRSQSAAVLAVLAEGPLDAAVAACPGWDLARLAGHLGRVHRWAALAVRTRSEPDPSEVPKPPREPAEVAAYLADAADDIVTALRAAAGDPSGEWWTFLGRPGPLAFWGRRMAVETGLHRWDAELAVGRAPGAFPAHLAADGIDELLAWHAPARLGGHDGIDIGGSLHLHCTDADGEWTVHTDDGVYRLTRDHTKGDAAVRGPAGTLLLALWRRIPLDAAGLEVFGDAEVARRFVALGVQ